MLGLKEGSVLSPRNMHSDQDMVPSYHFMGGENEVDLRKVIWECLRESKGQKSQRYSYFQVRRKTSQSNEDYIK